MSPPTLFSCSSRFTTEQSTVKASLFVSCILPYVTSRYVFAWGNFWMEKCRRDPGALIFQPIPDLSSAKFSYM